MIRNYTKLIAIHAPKFALRQPVTLHWEGRELPAQVLERWFNPDAAGGHWRYRLNLGPRLFAELLLESRD